MERLPALIWTNSSELLKRLAIKWKNLAMRGFFNASSIVIKSVEFICQWKQTVTSWTCVVHCIG